MGWTMGQARLSPFSGKVRMKKILVFSTIMFIAACLIGLGYVSEGIVKSWGKKTGCFACHTEIIAEAISLDAQIILENNKPVGYFLLSAINSIEVKAFFDRLDRHKVKRAIIEIHSPGGNLFEAQRIVGLMRHWQSEGGKIETRLLGAALSAGFYVFIAGDVRLVDRDSDLMWHEIQSRNVDDDYARKHLQAIRNRYIATRGKLTKAEIDTKISKQEFWMSGKEAVRFGFATGFLDKGK